jgi:hypothetical protein
VNERKPWTAEARAAASARMKAIIAARGGKTNFQVGAKRKKGPMKKRKHWTQTPEGRKRMSAAIKAQHRAKRERGLAIVNGHNGVGPSSAPTMVKSARGFAKDAVKHLAILGAKQRASELQRELDTLQMFIRSGEGNVKSGGRS